jgi:hypothetical protein
MTSKNEGNVGYGRPPAEHRFDPNKQGSRRGRPAGSRNIKTVVQAIAREKHRVKHQGKVVELTTVELLLHTLSVKAMRGDLPANKALEKLRDRICPPNDELGCLLVPEVMPAELFIELLEKRNARAKRPKTI